MKQKSDLQAVNTNVLKSRSWQSRDTLAGSHPLPSPALQLGTGSAAALRNRSVTWAESTERAEEFWWCCCCWKQQSFAEGSRKSQEILQICSYAFAVCEKCSQDSKPRNWQIFIFFFGKNVNSCIPKFSTQKSEGDLGNKRITLLKRCITNCISNIKSTEKDHTTSPVENRCLNRISRRISVRGWFCKKWFYYSFAVFFLTYRLPKKWKYGTNIPSTSFLKLLLFFFFLIALTGPNINLKLNF